jgi:hypothetical protein
MYVLKDAFTISYEYTCRKRREKLGTDQHKTGACSLLTQARYIRRRIQMANTVQLELTIA